MRRTKLCPKCGSREIAIIPGSARGAFGTGNHIPIGATIFSAVKVSRYLCGGCGFIEEWVDDPKDVEKVKMAYGESKP